MRLLFYIALCVVVWYVTKAAIRYYLPKSNGDRRNIPPDDRGPGGESRENYREAKDARYRDLE